MFTTIFIFLYLSFSSFTYFCKQLWSRFEHEVGVAVMLRAPVFAHADWFSVKHNDVDEAVVVC